MSRQGKDDIDAYINELKANNVYSNKEYYTRLKKKLKEVSSCADFLETNDDIKELDDCIRNTIMNY